MIFLETNSSVWHVATRLLSLGYRQIRCSNIRFKERIGRFPPALALLNKIGTWAKQLELQKPDAGYFFGSCEVNFNDVSCILPLVQSKACCWSIWSHLFAPCTG